MTTEGGKHDDDDAADRRDGMTLADYRVIGVAPDLTEAQFSAILQAAGSPALSAAHAVYQYCVKRGCSPAFLLGMFLRESGMGKAGTATITHSWGNTRLPVHGGVTPVRMTTATEARSGAFPVFRDWIDGGIATAARWLDYAPYQGKATVAQIIPLWAPNSDGNDSAAYTAGVLASIAGWVTQKGAIVAPSKPTVTSKPSPNCGYGGAAYKPEAICWHITAGSGASAVNWLTSPASNASANYVVLETGETVELVNPEAGPNGAAWANGNYNQPDLTNPLIAGWVKAGINGNLRVISIEHAGQSSGNKGGSLTAAQVAATIALNAWLCQRFGIAPDQDHILGHYQFDNVTRHNCPGFSAAEWSSWVGRIAALVKGGGQTVQDSIATGVGAQPEGIDVTIDARGHTIMTIDFGGAATEVKGFVIPDAGVTIGNAQDETWHRSVQQTVFQQWAKEG